MDTRCSRSGRSDAVKRPRLCWAGPDGARLRLRPCVPRESNVECAVPSASTARQPKAPESLPSEPWSSQGSPACTRAIALRITSAGLGFVQYAAKQAIVDLALLRERLRANQCRKTSFATLPTPWRRQGYLLQQSAAFNGFFTFGLNNLMPANELGAVLLAKPRHSFLLDSLMQRAIGRRGHPLDTSVGRQSAFSRSDAGATERRS